MRRFTLTFLGLLLAAGCGESDSSDDGSGTACIPGTTQACLGDDQCDGVQSCKDDGSGFGDCSCGAAGTDAGSGGTGGSGGTHSAGTGGSSSAGKGGSSSSGGANSGGTGGTSSGGTGSGGGATGGTPAGGQAGSTSGGAGGSGSTEYCGDGVRNGTEACDDGVNDSSYNGCAWGCVTLGPYCGDGIKSNGEGCDDAVNDGSFASCAIDCSAAVPNYGQQGNSCIGSSDLCRDETCCASITIPGGSFPMGCAPGGSCVLYEQPEHTVTVSEFTLDKYEVTIGRFRRFVDAYSGSPPLRAGEHPLIPNTGWQSAWDIEMPTSANDLAVADICNQGNWTAVAGSNETASVNCISWYVAAAFCAWDGGRLPTEAEWEYAAAGGNENRLYPWGNSSTAEGTDASDLMNTTSGTLPVGQHPDGDGRWGHADLLAGKSEPVFDHFVTDWYEQPCTDCASLSSVYGRVRRGGFWISVPGDLRTAFRSHYTGPGNSNGIRCARDL